MLHRLQIGFRLCIDCVNRPALLYKLLEQGVQGNFFRIIKSMFSKDKCCVKWNSSVGDMFSNLCGVLQGGVISPTLFQIFLEDVFEYFSHDNGINIGSLLFKPFTLCRWPCAFFRIEIRPTKTMLMDFGNKPIEGCDEYNYLGIFFRHRLTGSKAIM